MKRDHHHWRLRACALAVGEAYSTHAAALPHPRAGLAGAACWIVGGLLTAGAVAPTSAQTTCPNITVANQSVVVTGDNTTPCTVTGSGNTVTVQLGAALTATQPTSTSPASLTIGRPFGTMVPLGVTTLVNNGTIGGPTVVRAIDYFQSGTGSSHDGGSVRFENNGIVQGQIRQASTFDGSDSGGGSGRSAPLTIINTGQILAGSGSPIVIADFTQNNGGQNFLLNNSGLIRGDLDLRHSPDMVINSGTIDGSIDLGLNQQRKGTLAVRPGWSITGVVRSSDTASDVSRGRAPATLALSGEGASSFDTSRIGNYSATATTPQFQGFGNFYKQGPSTWTLTGTANATYRPANNVAPQWWISGGTLVADTASLPWGVTFGERLYVDASALPGDTDYLAVSGSTATLRWNQDFDGTYAGTIAECTAIAGNCAKVIIGRVEKSGAGTLTLASATNAYSGGTSIRGGTLAIGADGALGASAGAVTLDGGTLRTTADIASARAITVQSASGIDTSAGTLALSTGLAGSAALTKSGASTLALNAAGSYSGQLTLAQGTLRLGATGALGSGSLRTTGSIVDYADGVTNAASIIIDSNSAQLQVASGSATQSGAISEAGGARPLEKIGAGTLVLANTGNSYSGGTTITAGTLAVSADGALGASSGGLVLGNGSLRADASFTSGRALGIVGNGGIEVSGSSQLLWSGALSGTGGTLTKAGTGTLVIAGAAGAFTGATTVAAGRLQVDSTLGSTSTTVASGATLGGSGSVAGSVTIGSGGRLAPGGLSAPGTLTVGALTLGPGSVLDYRLGTAADRTVVLGNFVLDGTVNASGSALSGAYRLFDFAAPGTFVNNTLNVGSLPAGYTGAVRVGFGFVNLLVSRGGQEVQLWNGNGAGGGSGNWDAATANWLDALSGVAGPWGGQVGVFGGSGGAVAVQGDRGFQGLQFTANGYTLSSTSGGRLELLGDAAAGPSAASFLNVDGGVTATIDVPLFGAKGLDKVGTGTLVLGGASTYTGDTTIQQGTLRLAGSDRLPTGTALTVNSGQFDLGGFAQTVGAVTLAAGSIDNGTLTGTSYEVQSGSVGAVLAGSGSLTKSGSGTVTLSGANTYTGTTTVSTGTLALSGSGSIADSSGLSLGSAGAAFDISNITAATRIKVLDGVTGSSVALGGKTLDVASGSYAGSIGGSGSLTKIGAGTLVLSGANGYSGGTQVQAGTLALAGGSALADGGAVTVATGATLRLDADETVGSLVSAGTVAGSGRTLTAASYTIDGGAVEANLGSGALTQRSGTTTLSGSAAAGSVNVTGGTLRLGAAERLAAGSALAVGGGSFDLGGYTQTLNAVTLAAGSIDNGTLTATSYEMQSGSVGAVLAGSGGLTKSGSGTVTLSGTNNYTGATTVPGGTLALSGAGSVAESSGVNLAATGTSFDVSGIAASTSIKSLDGVTGSSVALGSKTLDVASGSYAGSIGGSGALVKSGAGTLTLTGTNSYSGGTTLSQGRLVIGADAALGASGGALLLAGGTLQTTADIAMQRSVQVSAASGIDTVSGTLTLGSGLTGSGALLKSGSGTLALAAPGAYSGELTLAAGTLALEASGALGSGSLRTTGSTVAYADGVTNSAPIVLASNTTDLNVAAGTATQSGAISADGGARPLEKTGAGTLVLTGSNSYGGPTTISAGTLVANAASLPGDVDIRGTLRFDQSTDAAYAGRVSGSGQWIKDGAGTLAYSGDGTAFVGATQVAAGTLVVNQGLGGSLTVAPGATLTGSGQVGNLQLAGNITPAGSGIGTLTVAGNLTVAAGSTYQVQLQPSAQPVAGTDNDLIAVQGQTTLQGGVVELDPLAGRYRGRIRYTLLTSEGGVSGQFAGVSTTLPVSALFARYALGYGTDAVWLDVSAGDFAASAATVNQTAVATALDREFLVGPSPLDPLYTALFALPDAASAQAAYDSLSGEVHASALLGVQQANRAFEQTVATRLRSGRGGSWLSPVAADAPAAGADGLWVAPIMADSTLDGNGNASEAQLRDYGVALGYDRQIDNDLRAGLALGGNDASTRLDRSNGGSADYSGFRLGAYVSWRPQRWRVDGQIYGGQQWLRTSRTVAVGSSVENYTASYTLPALGAAVEAAWRLPLEAPVALAPFAGAAYQQLWRPAATESAGALGAQLALASQRSSSAPVWLGLESELPLDADGWRGAVGLRLGGVGQLGNTDTESQASFALAPATTAMTVYGVPLARSSALVGLRLDLARSGATQFALEYSGTFGGGVFSNTGRLALSWAF
ncbi:MAG: autotransporter-associated beta strand repeat-containing protein [Betaproteobacteria bacterium]